MATAAQIEANRLNAQKSTGPKTDEGKARVRRNAVKHGMTARTIMPVPPQEDPKELEDRTQQAITAMKPRNPLKLDLVCRRCGCRGSSIALSGSRRPTWPTGSEWLRGRGRRRSARKRLSRVHDLGSTLFFQAGIGPGYSSATADDYPAVIVRRLEESAEGCRWLLARWTELLNVLDRKAAWRDPEMIRFVGLLGSAVSSALRPGTQFPLPCLRCVLDHRVGQKFWKDRGDGLPLGYKGGFQFVPYREIAPPPSDETDGADPHPVGHRAARRPAQ